MGEQQRWPGSLSVRQVRVARPTDRLDDVVHFYTHLLGLPELGGFRDHHGYDGVFIGLPDWSYHLEFTSHRSGSPCPAPTHDNLLVLYLATREDMDALVCRLRNAGCLPVPAENPYWTRTGAVTIEDPDGWRLVLTVADMGASSVGPADAEAI